MADLSVLPRPKAERADDGTLSNPEGWSLVLVAADAETTVAAWDDAGVFHQWETTETIVRQLVDALAQMQVVLEGLTRT